MEELFSDNITALRECGLVSNLLKDSELALLKAVLSVPLIIAGRVSRKYWESGWQLK